MKQMQKHRTQVDTRPISETQFSHVSKIFICSVCQVSVFLTCGNLDFICPPRHRELTRRTTVKIGKSDKAQPCKLVESRSCRFFRKVKPTVPALACRANRTGAQGTGRVPSYRFQCVESQVKSRTSWAREPFEFGGCHFRE